MLSLRNTSKGVDLPVLDFGRGTLPDVPAANNWMRGKPEMPTLRRSFWLAVQRDGVERDGRFLQVEFRARRPPSTRQIQCSDRENAGSAGTSWWFHDIKLHCI
jgi:hypothetical protein